MQHCVFIHTNHKQIVGALVAEYALRRNSKHSDEFDVQSAVLARTRLKLEVLEKQVATLEEKLLDLPD